MEVSGDLRAPAALPPGKELLVAMAEGAGCVPESKYSTNQKQLPAWNIHLCATTGIHLASCPVSTEGSFPG
jgi:hypothetical protein